MKTGIVSGCTAVMLAMWTHGQGVIQKPAANKVPDRPAGGSVELSYGDHELQKLDYWRPERAGAPLVVFVHGGGWKRGDKKHSADTKASHFRGQGYGFASINYRLVPEVTAEEQAHDVALALAFMVKDAKRLGFDPRKIVLMGHSAGAHLAALVGTDPRYLKKAGLDVASLRGVIPLDGACYDVPRQFALGAPVMRETYEEAFGIGKERQTALSPVHHAAAPNAPDFLILHVQRMDGAAQSKALGDALKLVGTNVEVRGFEGTGLRGHAEINRRLGDPEYAATPVVDEWLKNVFGAR